MLTYILKRIGLICTIISISLYAGFNLHAAEIDTSDEVSVDFDTTITTGMSVRVSKRDKDNIGVQNDGNDPDAINFDNGNLNYDRGDVVSASAKVTHELFIDSGDTRFFARGFYFYDDAVVGGKTARTPLPDVAKTISGRDFKLLDLYMDQDFDVGDRAGTIRIGNQVINWGESLFIRNGLNSINPVDVSKIRIAGAEIRDALEPLPAVDLRMDVNDNWSFEGFYLGGWNNTEIEPNGTFYSTNDFISPGASVVHLTSLAASDENYTACNNPVEGLRGTTLPSVISIFVTPIKIAKRANEIKSLDPSRTDATTEAINQLTKSAVSSWSSAPICANVPRTADRNPASGGQFGFALRGFLPKFNYAEMGIYFANIHSRLPVVSGIVGTEDSIEIKGNIDLYMLKDGTVTLNPDSNVTLKGNYAKTTRYFREFPKDIGLFGISLNTELGMTGWSLQGELVYRKDQPLQYDDDQIFKYGLSALENLRVEESKNLVGFIYPPGSFKNQLTALYGPAKFGQEIVGWKRKDVVQVQLAAAKLLGPSFLGDSSAFLVELGATHVSGMESKDILRYEGADNLGADPTSWGYRLIGQATFNNAIGALTLKPRVAFSHDVDGTAPAPIQNFKEGRKIITLSVGGNYLDTWTGNLSYTNSFDNDYDLNDRDFVSFSVSRSF